MKKLLSIVAALVFLSTIAMASQSFSVLPNTGTLSGLSLVNGVNSNEDALRTSFAGTTAPSGPEVGQLWLTTSGTNALEVYYNNTWNALSGTGTGAALAVTSTSANATFFPLFATTTGSSVSTVFIQTPSLTYNPSTAILSIPTGGKYEVNGTQIACSNLSNGATGCSTATGTSGATIPLLNASNTWSGVQTHNAGDLVLASSTTGVAITNGTGVVSAVATLGNSFLTNTGITLGTTAISLGSTVTAITGVASISYGASLTSGSVLDMSSQTTSMLLPSGTTGNRPTGVAGMMRYNSTVPALEAYYNNAWNTLGGGGGGGIGGSSGSTDRAIIIANGTGGSTIQSSSPSTVDANGIPFFSGANHSLGSSVSVTSSTALAAVTTLGTSVTSGSAYYVQFFFPVTSSTAGGGKFDWNGGTATASNVNGSTVGFNDPLTSLSAGICNDTGDAAWECTGSFAFTATGSGTLIPRFAQSVSNATPSTLPINSNVIVTRIR